MNNPDFFAKTCKMSENDAKHFIKQFEALLEWKDTDDVLDAGCGLGNVTKNVILSAAPKKINQLIGTDVSEKMIEFARKENNDSKIKYIQFDIAAASIPTNFEKAFDHIFSFYCLHWVENQSAAFANLYKMLRPGGQMLITLVTQNSNYRPLDDLSKQEKWQNYMSNYRRSLHPYEFSKNRINILKNALIGNGFTINYLEVYNKKHDFTLDNFHTFILSLNPFLKQIPPDQQDSFIKEYLIRVKMQTRIQCFSNEEGNSMVRYNYEVMCAFVTKSL